MPRLIRKLCLGIALVALALIVTDRLLLLALPSDFEAKAKRIWSVYVSKRERDQRMSLRDVEAIMGRKADIALVPIGGITSGSRWYWIDAETGERIRVLGWSPAEVMYPNEPVVATKRRPGLLDRLCTWFGW